MNINTNRQELLKSLSRVQGIVVRKSTKPILSNCCLDASSGRLSIKATDLEIGLTVEQSAEIITDGSITLGAKQLFDIVKELPEDRVNIESTPNDWVKIRSGKSNFKIMGLSAADFPNIPPVRDVGGFKVDIKDFQDLISKTAYAMSTDDTRYNLNGIFMERIENSGENYLRLVATDGNRLSYMERPVDGKWKLSHDVLIPRKGILEAKKMLDVGEGTFTMKVDEKQVTVQHENVTLMMRLVEGKFPPYKQVIPQDCKHGIKVGREDLLSSLRRVALVTNDRVRGVKFKLSPGHLEISASNPDVGEAVEEMKAIYKGKTMEIGFNERYFSDVLSNLDDEQVFLRFKGEDVGPCVIRSEVDKGFLAVIMPMRL